MPNVFWHHKCIQQSLLKNFLFLLKIHGQNICLSENIVADRARFAEIYQAIQQRKRIAVNIGSALPDLQKAVNRRLTDLEQKEQNVLV